MARDYLVLSIPLAAVVLVLSIMDFDYNTRPVQNTVIERVEVPRQTVHKQRVSYWDRLASEDLSVYYKVNDQVKLTRAEVRCLALNIFHEAALEPYSGKVAVAQVTHNRLKNGRWGNTWCEVIYSPAQFSWTLSKSKREMNPKGQKWNESIDAAYDYVMGGLRIHGLEQSLHYHATWMEQYPRWSRTKVAVREIGQHVFYKKPS